jgi:hypothetical protein
LAAGKALNRWACGVFPALGQTNAPKIVPGFGWQVIVRGKGVSFRHEAAGGREHTTKTSERARRVFFTQI